MRATYNIQSKGISLKTTNQISVRLNEMQYCQKIRLNWIILLTKTIEKNIIGSYPYSAEAVQKVRIKNSNNMLSTIEVQYRLLI